MMTEQGRVLSALLQGAFICQITDEEAWRFLKSRDNAAQLEPHLALLNRTLSTTAEGDVFFACKCSFSLRKSQHRHGISIKIA